MPNHSTLKLGAILAPPHPAIPHLAAICPTALRATNGVTDWYSRVAEWGMMGNDIVGDCTSAAIGHAILQWTTYTDAAPVKMGAHAILAAYSMYSGYNPADPATDQGATLAAALRYWIVTGMDTPGGGPDMLDGVARVNVSDQGQIMRAISDFGNVYVAVALPLSAQTEEVWQSTTDAPGSWGGHCVPLVGYNAIGPICVTWGAIKQMTWDWWRAYGTEAYAPLSLDWIKRSGLDPNGVDWGTVKQAMDAL